MATFLARRRPRRYALVPLLALVLVAGLTAGSGLLGVRADSGNTVEACVSIYTGSVRMSAYGGPITCSSSEFKRSWDASASPSPNPSPSPGGLTDVQIVTADVSHNLASNVALNADCPANTQVIGGGATVSNDLFRLTSSHPNEQGNYWYAAASVGSPPSPVTLVVYAVCASFAP